MLKLTHKTEAPKTADAVPQSPSKVLIVMWANRQPEFPLFHPESFLGQFMGDVAGAPVLSFAQGEAIFDAKDDADEKDLPEARLKATQIFKNYPLQPMVLMGSLTMQAFGAYSQILKYGYLDWLSLGERTVAAVPDGFTGKWWHQPGNLDRAQAFFRELSGISPMSNVKRLTRWGDIDPDELERLARLHPSVAEAAAAFSMPLRTFERRLQDPDLREAWERGKSDTAFKLRQKQLDLALKGNQRMLEFLGEHLLGQRQDAHVSISIGEVSARISLTRAELEQELRTLDAEFQVQESNASDAEIKVIPATVDEGEE